jgi:hypothetical protein
LGAGAAAQTAPADASSITTSGLPKPMLEG